MELLRPVKTVALLGIVESRFLLIIFYKNNNLDTEKGYIDPTIENQFEGQVTTVWSGKAQGAIYPFGFPSNGKSKL